jgi:hypothetical protein
LRANINIESRRKQLQGFNKNLGVFAYGTNNDYPERMELAIASSSTAKRCVDKLRKFILGKGVGDLNLKQIGSNNEKIYELIKGISIDIAQHNGFVIHVNYEGDSSGKIHPSSVTHIPLIFARKGAKDDKDHIGKICLHSNWYEAKKDDLKVINSYNPIKKVILSQIEKSGGWDNYNGQVLYYSFDTNRIYPISPMEVVEDAGFSQKAIQRLNRTSLEKGRFGTTLVITESMIDSDLDLETEEGQIEFRNQKKDRDNFREGLKKSRGVNSAETIMHIDVDTEQDDLNKAIKVVQLDSNINDKMFAESRKASKEDICEAFGVPIELITPKASLFGQSGEAMKQLKLELQEDTEEQRTTIENILNDIFKRMKDPFEIKIEKLIEDVNNGSGNSES